MVKVTGLVKVLHSRRVTYRALWLETVYIKVFTMIAEPSAELQAAVMDTLQCIWCHGNMVTN